MECLKSIRFHAAFVVVDSHFCLHWLTSVIDCTSIQYSIEARVFEYSHIEQIKFQPRFFFAIQLQRSTQKWRCEKIKESNIQTVPFGLLLFAFSSNKTFPLMINFQTSLLYVPHTCSHFISTFLSLSLSHPLCRVSYVCMMLFFSTTEKKFNEEHIWSKHM